MGDISEFNGLIVIGSFLAVSVLLMSWIPPALLYTPSNERTITPPSYFESSELILWNSTRVHNLTYDFYSESWGKSEFGHDMVLNAYDYLVGLTPMLHIENKHVIPFIPLFWYDTHRMDWINLDSGINRGGILREDEIIEDWNNNRNTATYTVKCSHFYMRADLVYNTSAYSGIRDAWVNDGLSIIFGIEWDERGTSYDAWSLMSSILFFGLPTVNPYINALIAVPVWIAVTYIAYILVLRAIGAVFGGGGA